MLLLWIDNHGGVVGGIRETLVPMGWCNLFWRNVLNDFYFSWSPWAWLGLDFGPQKWPFWILKTHEIWPIDRCYGKVPSNQGSMEKLFAAFFMGTRNLSDALSPIPNGLPQPKWNLLFIYILAVFEGFSFGHFGLIPCVWTTQNGQSCVQKKDKNLPKTIMKFPSHLEQLVWS